MKNLEKFIIKLQRTQKVGNKWETIEIPYLKVAGRLYLAREDLQSIETDVVVNENYVIVKAKVKLKNGKEFTGHGSNLILKAEEKSGRIISTLVDKAIEKAETVAVGRALALAGYGLEEIGEIASAEEVEDLEE